MRRRFTRPNIFRQLKRFGVYQGDWKYILIPTAAAYILPFILGLWLYYVPLGAVTFILTLALFTFLRASKPKCWLFHQLDAASDGWSKYRRPIGDEYEIEDWITRDHS